MKGYDKFVHEQRELLLLSFFQGWMFSFSALQGKLNYPKGDQIIREILTNIYITSFLTSICPKCMAHDQGSDHSRTQSPLVGKDINMCSGIGI